jgi:hypothetical protein
VTSTKERKMTNLGKLKTTAIAGFAIGMIGTVAYADQVILDDLIVDGSACIGQDCVNGESFGFDTLRLKENNLRIKADDTSTTASFPSTDWQITFNDSANGGSNKFSIDDISGGRTPLTLIAGAPSHSLFVSSSGNLGLGTSTPAVQLHTKDGNTPTLRLEQDGSSGFAAQTWDVAANETNFFVRDATNGSTLPFRIRPSAPSSSIDIAADGDVGIGTSSPDSNLHVLTNVAAEEVMFHIQNTAAGASTIMQFENGLANWQFKNNGATGRLTMGDLGGTTPFKLAPNAVENLLKVGTTAIDQVDITGNLVMTGTLTTAAGNTCAAGCDRVFDETYDLPSIQDHATAMFANKFLPNVGATPDDAPTINISEKIGGMLNELEHAHIYISQMHTDMKLQSDTIAALTLRLEKLEN